MTGKPNEAPIEQNEDPTKETVKEESNPPEEMVPRSEFLKLQREADALKSQNDAKAKELEDKKLAIMKEKEDWKGIANINEAKAKEAEEKFQGLQNALTNNSKIQALRSAALKEGILDQSLDDLEMLDFDSVRVESTSSGKILVIGAEQAIKDLKIRKPHWFGTINPGINSGLPQTKPNHSGKMTINDLSVLEAAWKKNPRDPEAKSAYEKGIQRFNSQT